jgi:hypothetical protein
VSVVDVVCIHITTDDPQRTFRQILNKCNPFLPLCIGQRDAGMCHTNENRMKSFVQ